MARLSRPRRPSHAVDVRLAVGRQVEIQHHVHGGDVEASSGDVRRDEDVSTSGAEFAERAETGRLRELAVQGDGAEAEGAQEDGQALGFVHSAGEDDGGLAGGFVEEVDEVDVLVLVGDEEVGLEQGGYGLVFVGRDGDPQRVRERGALEGFDFGRHRGGEEVGASFAREDFEDLVQDRAEVEVQQPVGFVHDQVFEVAEREAFRVFEVVEQPAWRGDDDVRFLAQRDGLGDHVHSADYDGASDRYQGAEGFEGLGDLEGEFAGRGHDEGEKRLRFVH